MSTSSIDDRHTPSPSAANTPPLSVPSNKLQFYYPPQISVESEAGYLASISQQSSFDVTGLSEDREGSLDSPRHQASLRLSQFPSVSTSRTLEEEETLTPQFSDASELSASPLPPRKRPLRRSSEVPRPYTTALTLKVPSGDMVEEDAPSVDQRGRHGQRRASLDDVMMSVYRNFHKMPGNVK